MSLRRILRDQQHARWVGAARDGDGRAFRSLYRELFPRVTGYLSVRLGSRQDIEDLTSEVFYRMLDHLDRFDPRRGSVLSWVLTIVHHALVDHVRRERGHPSLEAVDPRYVQVHDDPLDRLIRDEQTVALHELMVSLDPATRNLFDLRYTMDMTYQEIAGLFEISEDSVKQRFSRAHRRLRVALEKVRDSQDA